MQSCWCFYLVLKPKQAKRRLFAVAVLCNLCVKKAFDWAVFCTAGMLQEKPCVMLQLHVWHQPTRMCQSVIYDCFQIIWLLWGMCNCHFCVMLTWVLIKRDFYIPLHTYPVPSCLYVLLEHHMLCMRNTALSQCWTHQLFGLQKGAFKNGYWHVIFYSYKESHWEQNVCHLKTGSDDSGSFPIHEEPAVLQVIWPCWF